MTDSRIEKLADVLVNYSVAVQPGHKVVVQGGTPGGPLLEAIYAKVLQAGGHPLMLATLPNTQELLFRYASDEQLQHVAEPLKLAVKTYDAFIRIDATMNTKALSSVDPSKMVLAAQAQAEISTTVMQRSAAGELRWSLAVFPTNAQAQEAEMSLAEYEDFVYGACLPDMDAPVGYWRRFSTWQQKIVDWLDPKEQVHVIAPGTDLRLSIAGRSFVNCDGRYNMPDGEVFTGPVEDSVQGHVSFTYPVIYGGREVSGVRLYFEDGKVVKASADKNEDFLIQTLDTDAGARYVGEFAIGTNEGITRFTRHMLFDEKINGSFHMAMGRGYPETGSKNKSAIHWDMLSDMCDGGEIWVDDELLYKDGKFVIEF